MKFFRDRTLRIKTAYLLGLLLLVLIVQLIILRWNVRSLENLHYHESFARKAQIACQQVFLNTTLYLQGQTELGSRLIADIDHHDYLLNTLANGGRVDGTSIFLHKLPRIPKISFDELLKHWNAYKQGAIQATVNDKGLQDETVEKLLPGRWLSVSSWYEKLLEDLDQELVSTRTALTGWIIGFITLDLIMVVFLYYAFVNGVIRPLKVIEENTIERVHTIGLPDNELNDIAHHINEVIEQLKDASQFIQAIGEGKLSLNYQELDSHYQPGKNKLADSLIEMQQKLKALNDEEKKRQWINEGLTKFVDILRTGGDNITALGDKIIATLVQYTGSNQGGLYLLNDEDANNKHLELMAMFAFDTKKFETQRIKLGEGILGQTFLEKETTYITNIPHEYIRITSGLGGTNPKAILVVPLKIDQEVYGVVELASFEEYESHVIGFVERLGETVASTLASVKTTQRNRNLLEQSKTSTEVMQAQEEEMRQNMEELTAAQEEMVRKEREYVARINSLEAQLKSGASPDLLEETRKELERIGRESSARIQELEEQLSAQQPRPADWTVVEEVEKTLRVNLEALRITQEELGKHKK